MEEETEVLDWEEDEEQAQDSNTAADNDGISLGSASGDEDENKASNTAPYIRRSHSPAPRRQSDATISTSHVLSTPAESPSKDKDSSRPRSSSGRRSSGRGDREEVASPSKSARKRAKKAARDPQPSTLPKAIPGLPAKPVSVNATFLPSTSTIAIEATAMSQSKGKNGLATTSSSTTTSKANGDQPSHSSGPTINLLPSSTHSQRERDEPLPPDWEIRHSRSTNVTYYYNTRTHDSKWERPTLETLQASKTAPQLTYDDRHYRPGDTSGQGRPDSDLPSSKGKGPRERDTWRGSDHPEDVEEDDRTYDHDFRGRAPRTYRSRRSISPGSPKRSRDLSEPRGSRYPASDRLPDQVSRRGADVDRGQPDRPIGSRYGRLQETDRHWEPSGPLPNSLSRSGYEQPDAHNSGKRSRRPPQDPSTQSYNDRAEPLSYDAREERRRNAPRTRSPDVDSKEHARNNPSSANRHRSRSPPPQLLMAPGLPPPPVAARNSASLTGSSSAGSKRSRPSRFAQVPAQPDLKDEDDWVPDEFKPGKSERQASAFSPPRRERSRDSERGSTMGPRTDRDVADSESSHDPAQRREQSRSDPPPETERRGSPALPSPTRPRRQPLPPQSARFREMSSGGRRPPPSAPTAPAAALERDPQPHQEPRASKFGPPPPSLAPSISSSNTRMDVDSAGPSNGKSFARGIPDGPRARSRSLDRRNHDNQRGRPARMRSRSRTRSESRSRGYARSPSPPRRRSRSRSLPPRTDAGASDPAMRRIGQPLPPVAPRGRPPKRGRRGRELTAAATGTNNIPVGTGSTPSRYPPPPPRGLSGANTVALTNAKSRGFGGLDEVHPPPGSPSLPPRRRRESPQPNGPSPPNEPRKRSTSPPRRYPDSRDFPYRMEMDKPMQMRSRSRSHSPRWRRPDSREPPLRQGPSQGVDRSQDRPHSREREREAPRNEGREHDDAQHSNRGRRTPSPRRREPDNAHPQNGMGLTHPLPMKPPTVSSPSHPRSPTNQRYRSPPRQQAKPPVKIRRPPPMAQEMGEPVSGPTPAPVPMMVDERDREERPPPVRRGASLLDRLSGIPPDVEGLSLRDRVHVPAKRERTPEEYDERYDDRRDEPGGGKRRRGPGGGGRRSRRAGKMAM